MSPRVSVVGKAEVEKRLSAGASKPALRIGEGFRTRVGLKVQDGCDHACTYCIVHVARGKARSVSPEDALREAVAYFDAGVKELVLTGIDIGAYDSQGVRLPELARRLLEAADAHCAPGERPARIRISSIEPRSIDDELVTLLATSEGRLCRHLHVPLQSGNTKVLREMHRPYTAAQFEDLVGRLRGEVPRIALSTDVITGFPGESDDDFEDTFELVEKAQFMRLHVFPYSRREGTPAADRPDQVSPEVKRQRAARLRSLGTMLAAQDLRSRVNAEELCLVEGETCLTESYHELPAPKGAETGSLVPLAL